MPCCLPKVVPHPQRKKHNPPPRAPHAPRHSGGGAVPFSDTGPPRTHAGEATKNSKKEKENISSEWVGALQRAGGGFALFWLNGGGENQTSQSIPIIMNLKAKHMEIQNSSK